MRHILRRREFTIHGFLQHHVFDNVSFADMPLRRLFWNLLVDQGRAHEAGADHVGADMVFRTFFRHDFGQPEQSVLGRNISAIATQC